MDQNVTMFSSSFSNNVITFVNICLLSFHPWLGKPTVMPATKINKTK